MSTILIAENNRDFAYVIHWFFTNKGNKVFTSNKGEEVLELYESERPDIILLDISLDDNTNGIEVARRIRVKDKNTLIVFMSGENNSPTDVVEAFSMGGNYFVKKPVSLEELDALVQSALRVHVSVPTYNLGSIIFNVKERLLIENGRQEYLTEKETYVLKILAEYSNSIVDTITILENVWGNDDREESLRNCISSLRKKLEHSFVSIETIKGKGYRLCIPE